MRRLFTLFILIPIGVVIVALAVANRQMITVSIPPQVGDAPLWSFQAPLFLLILATLIFGLFLGSGVTWLKQGKHRKQVRVQKHHAAKMEEEVEKQKHRVDELVDEVTNEERALTALGLPSSSKAA